MAAAITFNVEPRAEEALVEVKSMQGHGLSGDIIVQVSLTSPVVREEQLAAAAANGCYFPLIVSIYYDCCKSFEFEFEFEFLFL